MRRSDIVFELKGSPKGAFDGETWVFRRREQWAVMGPNNSGKSYLAALLAGTAPPRGVGLAFGEEGAEDHVAVATFSQQQDHALGGWLQARWHSLEEDSPSVRTFLSYEGVNEISPFEVRGNDTAGRRTFARLLRKVSGIFTLRPLLGRLMAQLSNGEMRRVLLARALLKSPKLLVLDDPFAGLDPTMRARLHAALNRLADEGLPMVLMVRHEDEIPACATHLLLLKNVRIAGQRRLACRGMAAGGFPSLRPKAARAICPHHADGDACQPIIKLRGVTVRYGKRTVLDKLDWTVRVGERWLIVGPNGSGKTLLLSLITGDNPAAYANDVRVFGRPREPGESLWPIRRRIGQVSPEIQCYFDGGISVLDAVLSGRLNAEGGVARPTRAAREDARRWLRELGLTDAEKVPFGELSAGRQRLVLLARAMLPQPDLLLLDEPCLNLDYAARRHVLGALERLLRNRRKETVICVSHRSDDVPRGFQRMLTLGP